MFTVWSLSSTKNLKGPKTRSLPTVYPVFLVFLITPRVGNSSLSGLKDGSKR